MQCDNIFNNLTQGSIKGEAKGYAVPVLHYNNLIQVSIKGKSRGYVHQVLAYNNLM